MTNTHPPRITFQPLAEHHLPLLKRWVQNPQVLAGYPTTYEKQAEKLHINDIASFVFAINDTQAGYIQHWYLKDYAKNCPWIERITPAYGAFDIGIDIYIGEDRFRGCGLGAPVLHAFINHARTTTNTGQITIDPVKTNLRAIKAYEKAGFKPLFDFVNGDGQDAVFMVFEG